MKLFASDYDGTLFKNEELTDYDLQMIHEFRDAGNKFGVATGRPIDSIIVELEKYKIPYDFVVGINGGVVLNGQQEELYGSSFNKKIIAELIALFIEEKVLYYGINDGYALSGADGLENFPTDYFNITLSDFNHLMDNGVKGMYVRHKTHSHAIDLSAKINHMFQPYGIHSLPNYESIDIGVDGISKSTGIERVLKHFEDKEISQVFTVGDAHNDASMIQDYYGFAMDNGVEEIKEISKEVVATVGDALRKALDL